MEYVSWCLIRATPPSGGDPEKSAGVSLQLWHNKYLGPFPVNQKWKSYMKVRWSELVTATLSVCWIWELMYVPQ